MATKQKKQNPEPPAKPEIEIPGLSELELAWEAEQEDDISFSRMMRDQNNDGAHFKRAPRPAKSLDQLIAEYPAAALYLECENARGESSGYSQWPDRAMAMLKQGEPVKKVEREIKKIKAA